MLRYLHLQFIKLKSLINKDVIICAVDKKDSMTYIIKNGSIVDTIPISNDIIRGKRSKIPLFYDFEFDKENLNKVIKEYII